MAGLSTSAGRLFRRFWWLGLIAGVAGMVFAPPLIESAFVRGPRDSPSLHAKPLAVLDGAGQTLGWLDIRYPATLRENQDGAVEVRYLPDLSLWRTHPAWARNLKLAATVTGAGFALKPEPLSYTFNNARVMAGGDSHIWLMAPEHEGDYSLLVTLAAQPDKFRVAHFTANGVSVQRPDQAVLPVRVVTEYSVPKVVVEVAKAAAGLASFLLTLPAGLLLLTRTLSPKSGGKTPAKRRGRPS